MGDRARQVPWGAALEVVGRLAENRNVEVFADLCGEKVVDLAMTRNRARFASKPVDVDRVTATFAE